MRVVLQRVTSGKVSVGGRTVGAIGAGLVLLVGVGQNDTPSEAELLAQKIANLRIFSDEEGKFNLAALDVKAEILIVSQFTLFADCRKGRRPSFVDAARPELAEPLIELFAEHLRSLGFKVATGQFQAEMLVEILNSGPVTIWLDSNELAGVHR